MTAYKKPADRGIFHAKKTGNIPDCPSRSSYYFEFIRVREADLAKLICEANYFFYRVLASLSIGRTRKILISSATI